MYHRPENKDEEMAESRKIKRELTVSPLASELIDAVVKMSPEQQRELLAELMASKGAARRKYSRHPYRHEVQFSVDGKLFTGFIRNVSDGGAFVETLRSDLGRLDRGRQVTMSFEHPVNQKNIKRTGEIARTSQDGIGVAFDKLL